jgi:anti-anti-sigma factor
MKLNGTFEIEQTDGTVILTALTDLGEFELEYVKRRFEETLERLAMRHIDNVIVDLNHADYYGSSALGFFVSLWKLVAGNGGQLVLCAVSKHGAEILRVTHLDRLWDIFDSRDDALQSLLEKEHRCAASCA